MGFISTMVILNDHLHEVGKDKDFGSKVQRAILRLPLERPVWVGHHAIAIESHHNSSYATLLVGRGMGVTLPVAVELTPHEDPEITLLKRLADKHGYRLARKATK